MDATDLLELWEQNKDRPAVVREYSDDLNEHLNTAEPVPDSDSLWKVRRWLERYKSTVTKQLREAADE